METITNYKLTMGPKELLSQPRINFLIPALEEAYSYSYDEQPNYRKLQFLLEKVLLLANKVPTSQFSWVKRF